MTARGRERRWPVVSALGIVQILNWGSSFYLPAVLAGPVAAETGWPLTWVVGGLSVGLMVAAFASPRVGLAIHRHGGRPILALAAVLLSAGLALLGVAPNLPVFLAGWTVIGLGMGCGLYDPAFATLGRLYGAEARPAITSLTLWGGFASTVCWPLSAFLVERIGWRGTCLAYSGLHLAVTLPLVLGMIPAMPARPGVRDTARRDEDALSTRERRAFVMMAGVLVLGGTVMALVSVHLIALLQARGVALASAVSYGALIGPAQVGARVVEMAMKGRHHPLWTLLAAMGLVSLGLGILAAGLTAVAVALVLYGAGNGIYSIARGAVPLALFGPVRYPLIVGRLAKPGLIAQALAPSLGAVVLASGGADATYGLLAVLALTNVALAAVLLRMRRPEGPGRRPLARPRP